MPFLYSVSQLENEKMLPWAGGLGQRAGIGSILFAVGRTLLILKIIKLIINV